MNESNNYENLYNNLLIEFNKFKEEYELLKIQLKKYTSLNGSKKKYYENNKEVLFEKHKEYVKSYKKNLSPEKIQEYNKRAYEKRKNKKNDEKLEKNI